jgi:hypothetical protein
LFHIVRSCGKREKFTSLAHYKHHGLKKLDGRKFGKQVAGHLKSLASKVADRPIILFGMLPIGPSYHGNILGGIIDRFILDFQGYFLDKWARYSQENIIYFECANVPSHVRNPAYFGADNRPNQLYLRAVNSMMAPTARAISLGHHRSFCPIVGMKTQ